MNHAARNLYTQMKKKTNFILIEALVFSIAKLTDGSKKNEWAQNVLSTRNL